MLYTTTESCERLKVGRTKLFELIANGDIASVRIGSARLIADVDLDDFESRLRASAAVPERVRALLAVVDAVGRVDIALIPMGTTLADLEAAKVALTCRRRGVPDEAA